MKGRWEVRKWNSFEEFYCVEEERQKATDRGSTFRDSFFIERDRTLFNHKRDPIERERLDTHKSKMG